jgi:hypothetical protein
MGLTNYPQGVNAGNIKYGTTAITGLGTVDLGLSAITQVQATLETIGAALGQPFVVSARGIAGGSAIFAVTALGGTAATTAGTVNWIATGTPR